MRSHFGMALVVTALGAIVACSSSSSTPPGSGDAGSDCTGTLTGVVGAGALCPVDSNGNPVSYDEAITNTCATEKLKTGDVEYGQCFEFLVFQVDLDATGNNFSKCFYDVGTHVLVGAILSSGAGNSQCGGSVDPSCTITGLTAGGSAFQSCAPVVDGGTVADTGGGGGG
jgi:hypothetical protein